MRKTWLEVERMTTRERLSMSSQEWPLEMLTVDYPLGFCDGCGRTMAFKASHTHRLVLQAYSRIPECAIGCGCES